MLFLDLQHYFLLPMHATDQSQTAKYTSLPGAEGAEFISRVTPAREIPPDAVARKNFGSPLARSPGKPDICEHPTCAPALARQQLYAEGKPAEILR